jgi:hypothetical protein
VMGEGEGFLSLMGHVCLIRLSCPFSAADAFFIDQTEKKKQQV